MFHYYFSQIYIHFHKNCGNKPLMSLQNDGQWKSSTELRNKTIFGLIGIVTYSLILNDLMVVFYV